MLVLNSRLRWSTVNGGVYHASRRPVIVVWGWTKSGQRCSTPTVKVMPCSDSWATTFKPQTRAQIRQNVSCNGVVGVGDFWSPRV
jgi:hypothetical protein